MNGENDVTVWRWLRWQDMTTEEHERLAHSLYRTQTYLLCLEPGTASEKRKRTTAINFLADMRRELRQRFGAVYADPVLEDELEPDLDVWGDCIAGLDLGE